MASFEGELTSYLQDVSEESEGLLGDIMQQDVAIQDYNFDQAKKLLDALKEVADLLIEFRKLKAELDYDNSEEAIRRELSPVYL